MFCGGGPVTKEHVWPEWIGQELSKLSSEPFRGTRGEGGAATRWKTRTLDVTVRRFCKPCNSGWMSVIPRFLGEPIVTFTDIFHALRPI